MCHLNNLCYSSEKTQENKEAEMARVTVRVSDLSGTNIPDEESVTRLSVEHPDYPEPIGLDVLPGDVLSALTDENSQFVIISLQDPDDPNPKRHVLWRDEFERLFQKGDSATVLQDAF